jgi:hypothetical protein
MSTMPTATATLMMTSTMMMVMVMVATTPVRRRQRSAGGGDGEDAKTMQADSGTVYPPMPVSIRNNGSYTQYRGLLRAIVAYMTLIGS